VAPHSVHLPPLTLFKKENPGRNGRRIFTAPSQFTHAPKSASPIGQPTGMVVRYRLGLPRPFERPHSDKSNPELILG
jgi:hypothetical protein